MITENTLRVWLIMVFVSVAVVFVANVWHTRKRRNRRVNHGQLFKHDRKSVRLSKRMYPK